MHFAALKEDNHASSLQRAKLELSQNVLYFEVSLFSILCRIDSEQNMAAMHCDVQDHRSKLCI